MNPEECLARKNPSEHASPSPLDGPHEVAPDVEGRALTKAVFAIDLRAVASIDPNVPVVNRDPEVCMANC
jgi:hypothetical protein